MSWQQEFLLELMSPSSFDETQIQQLVGAIDFVAYDRVADRGEMHTNLMSAAGVEAAFDMGGVAEAFDDFETRPGFAGIGAFGGGHAFAVGGMAGDADLNFAALVSQFTADDGAINFGGAAFFELGGEV